MIPLALRRIATMAFLLLSGAQANAALHQVGTKLVYDDLSNITWIRDANFPLTSGFQPDDGGRMTWNQTNAWIAQLSQATGTNWRLPTGEEFLRLQRDTFGYDVDKSIITWLPFFNVNGTAGPTGDADYWISGTPVEADPMICRLVYYYCDFNEPSNRALAWAVTAGQVQSAVPEVSSWSLLIAGSLVLLSFALRRRRPG